MNLAWLDFEPEAITANKTSMKGLLILLAQLHKVNCSPIPINLGHPLPEMSIQLYIIQHTQICVER